MRNVKTQQKAAEAKTTMNQSHEELETLCRRIAPGDFGGHPIYICFSSVLPGPLRPAASTWGYTGELLDLALHSWLMDSGRWRGRGAAIVVNDIAIREDVEDWAAEDPEFGAELYRTRVLAIVLHELSHTLSINLDFKPLPVAVAPEIESQTLAITTAWVAKSTENPWVTSGPVWLGHEAGFIRTLLHVIHRAYRLGIERLPDDMLFVASNYSLSPLGAYRRTLSSELDAFDQRITFDDLRTCSPPESFVELWKQDLHDWVDAQSDELAILEMVAALRPYINVR